MNTREERGMVIAALCRLSKNNKGDWLVPSQSGTEIYTVSLDSKSCTCPDCKENGFVCKHYFAASIVHKRDTLPDGTMIETKSVTLTEKKIYRQNWTAYNLAQSVEKHRFQELLFDLLQGVKEPVRPEGKRGRAPHTVRDSLFAAVFKVYSLFSTRRFSSDLRDAHDKGYTSKVVPGMKVCVFLENPTFTPILKNLISYSARPLRAVETSFAIDSSGFGSSKFERWFDQKYSVTRQKCVWVKTHIACGTKTNIVTAVRILDKDAGDSPQFIPLTRETREGFEIDEMSADKAYASLENFEEIANLGGQAYIAFKANATGACGGMFEKAFHLFKFNEAEYMQHYHKRSNVESTFSAVKRKFGDSVMSRNDTAMVNEVLCKLLAHNIVSLIHEQHELGIDPIFWDDNNEQENVEPAILKLSRSV